MNYPVKQNIKIPTKYQQNTNKKATKSSFSFGIKVKVSAHVNFQRLGGTTKIRTQNLKLKRRCFRCGLWFFDGCCPKSAYLVTTHLKIKKKNTVYKNLILQPASIWMMYANTHVCCLIDIHYSQKKLSYLEPHRLLVDPLAFSRSPSSSSCFSLTCHLVDRCVFITSKPSSARDQ